MRWILVLAAVCATSVLCAQTTKQQAKARKLLDRDKPYKVLTLCDHMMLGGKNPEFFTLRAEALNRIGKSGEAERDARSALQHFPNSSTALIQLAIAEQGQGSLDSARKHFQQVLQREPSPMEPYSPMDVSYRLALNYRSAKQCREAVALLDEAWRGRPLSTADSARIMRVKGECLAEMGDSTGARAALDKAVAIAPKDPVNYNSRGYYGRAFFGDHLGAIRDYDKALHLNPNYSYAFNNRGWSWYKLGDKDKALADIGRAKKRKVFNPFVYRNLGIIALESGDTSLACTQFRHALELGFTGLYGDEVEQLVKKHCGANTPGQAPVQAPDVPLDQPKDPQHPKPRTNAPE